MFSKQGQIRSGVIRRVPLVVGDELDAGKAGGVQPQAELTFKLKGPVDEEALLLRLNGETLSGGEVATTDASEPECEIRYIVGAPPLKTGRNYIELSLKGAPDGRIEFCSISLKVEYKAG